MASLGLVALGLLSAFVAILGFVAAGTLGFVVTVLALILGAGLVRVRGARRASS
jgi:hypothetical protein